MQTTTTAPRGGRRGLWGDGMLGRTRPNMNRPDGCIERYGVGVLDSGLVRGAQRSAVRVLKRIGRIIFRVW
jgi:hypothetical protein